MASGGALGVALGDSPEAWEPVLGDDYVEDRGKGRLRRDYGLLDISFQRIADQWRSFVISCQVHRLKEQLSGEAVPSPLWEEYGPFRLGITVESLPCDRAEEEARKRLLSESRPGDFVRIVESGGSGVRVDIVAVAWEDPLLSEVWSIGVSRASQS